MKSEEKLVFLSENLKYDVLQCCELLLYHLLHVTKQLLRHISVVLDNLIESNMIIDQLNKAIPVSFCIKTDNHIYLLKKLIARYNSLRSNFTTLHLI